MTAKQLARKYGKHLVGHTVLTEPCGAWPGGPAEVIQMRPDKMAPEIVFQVRHVTASDPDDPVILWEIGVLEHEDITLLK